ncbi:MAG: aspartate carbamoyltransferase catalytic subunit [Acidobacteria bacterium]|nr:aspartate carbamoyltransferase catalytic subunit [Acidobacteriota bacterium]
MPPPKTLARLSQRHLLGVEPLSAEDIELVLATAQKYQTRTATETRPVPRLELLRGKTLTLAFFEPSTRTRVSFEMAAQRLGMNTVNLALEASSVQKGESLLDTVKTLAAMRPNALVIRHAASGVPHFLARHTDVPILNAGDGQHEHPTQALLDALTIRDHKGTLGGLKVAILGDLLHSRVARSNIHLLAKFGTRIALAGPPPLVPKAFERLAPSVAVCARIEEALAEADVVMMLRVQLERQREPLFASPAEYARHYCLTPSRLAHAKPDAIVMHPGPFLRGIDIAGEVADSPRSVIPHQVENGVAVRMALLELLVGGAG